MKIPVSLAYLDWAATTPLCEEAASEMAPYFIPGVESLRQGGNANSLHTVGRNAFSAMEQSRIRLSHCLGCRPDELYFTSGATEADNTAVFGIVSAEKERRKHKGDSGFVPHIIVSSIEHEAVIAPAHLLERFGVEVTFIKPDRSGFITVESLKEALRPNTILVSIMLANNEIGSIQPIRELAQVAHDAGALFHTDAVQGFGKIPFNVRDLGVDAASVSAHKICGPKGIGAFYLKKGVPCDPFMLGGGQENGFRSGTQNVAGMVGFAAAAESMCNPDSLNKEAERLRSFRDRLYTSLCRVKGVRQSVPCNQGDVRYLPNIVSVVVDGVESESMILRLDREGISVSGGSACSSKSLAPNRILTEIGIDKDSALCSLRISMGRYTTEDEIEEFERAFRKMVEWARS